MAKTSSSRSSVNVKPLSDRLLVRRVEEEEVKKGGIIIPDTAKEKPQQADVIAVGPGKLNDDGKRTPIDVKVGDRVLLSKYAGTEIEIDDEECLIVNQDDILGVVLHI